MCWPRLLTDTILLERCGMRVFCFHQTHAVEMRIIELKKPIVSEIIAWEAQAVGRTAVHQGNDSD